MHLQEVDEILNLGNKAKKKGNSAKEALKAASNSQTSDIHTLDCEGIGKKLDLEEEKPWVRTPEGFQGLSTAFARKRLEIEGLNELSEKGGTPWYISFCKEMTGFFSLLLWFGSFLCFIAFGVQEIKEDKSNLYLGIVLSVVCFLTGLFSYSQSTKSAALMATFKNFIPKTCACYRDGKVGTLEAKELVRGDVVKINNGDNIPADLVMIDTQGDMKVDNSSLTGETEQLLRTAEISDKNTKLLETHRVAFSGTECKNGSGIGIVFGTADKTVIGAIANLAE